MEFAVIEFIDRIYGYTDTGKSPISTFSIYPKLSIS